MRRFNPHDFSEDNIIFKRHQVRLEHFPLRILSLGLTEFFPDYPYQETYPEYVFGHCDIVYQASLKAREIYVQALLFTDGFYEVHKPHEFEYEIGKCIAYTNYWLKFLEEIWRKADAD